MLPFAFLGEGLAPEDQMFVSQEDSPYGVVQDSEFRVIRTDSIRKVSASDLKPIYADRVLKLRSTLPVVKVQPKEKNLDLNSIYDSLETTPVYQRTLLRARGEDGIVEADEFENAVEFDPKAVDKLRTHLETLSGKVASRFNKTYLPIRMSFDQASAQVEGLMRDGFGLSEFSLETDMSHHLDSMVKLDMMWRYANSMKLPVGIRKIYFERLANSLFEAAEGEATSNRRRAAVARYSQALDNPVGKPMASSVGTIRYASKKEVS